MSRRPTSWAAAGVIALSVALAAAAGWKNSATTDEPYHLLAAHAHVVEGLADLNADKPPLPKLLSGLALAALHLRGTLRPPVERLYHLPEETQRFLYQNTVDADTMLLAARLPQLVFLAALLVATHTWGRRLWSERAALLAVAAVGLQPLVLGHAFLVHTDVPAAAAWTLTLLALHRFVNEPRCPSWPLGLALGFALAVKFSSGYLLAIALAAVLALSPRGQRAPKLRGLALATGLAALVVYVSYLPAIRNTSVADVEGTVEKVGRQWFGTETARAALSRVAGVSRPAALYGLGLLHVVETDRHGQSVNYFLGQTRVKGFVWYHPAALVLKTSAPFVALLVAGVAVRLRRGGADRRRDELFLLAPAGLYLVLAMGSAYDIGARHLLPVLPLLALWAAPVAVRSARSVSLGLAAGFLVSCAVSFPHYISHFDLLAGGSRTGGRYLQDSNLDWGQDWRRLGELAARNGWRSIVTVQLGTANPQYYLPGSRPFPDGGPPGPGYFAVSSYAETVGPAFISYIGYDEERRRLEALLGLLRARGERVGGVGTSLSVYRVR